MLVVPVKDLLEAGVHFGCRASRWNPKMEPFIFGRRNLIHIIDLKQTLRGLIRGTTFLQRLVAEGRQVLFVGTKRQAQGVIQETAKSVDMPYVTERWLGGTLTNFSTIRARLRRLEELEQIEAEGSLVGLSKKRLASLMREKRKIFRNLDGIRRMEKLPAPSSSWTRGRSTTPSRRRPSWASRWSRSSTPTVIPSRSTSRSRATTTRSAPSSSS